jgi:hypothetical protein
MDNELTSAIDELKAQGIAIEANGSPAGADTYRATAPNGEKYELRPADLLSLKTRGALDLEGLQEMHLARKETPDLHQPSSPGRPAC